MKKFSILLVFVVISILFLLSCTVQNSANNQNSELLPKTTATVMQTPPPQIPKLDIKSSEVTSLSLNTIYKDFFETGSRCRQSYNDLFGKEDGFFSVSSPCTFDLTFNRDGSAEKTIKLERWDKETKQKRIVENAVWKGKITTEQFDELAKAVVETEIFQNWNDMMMINVVNSRLKVIFPKGTRTLMSNVDEKTVKFLELMNSFKQLDGKVKWEKVN
jgi:hypothetical protein